MIFTFDDRKKSLYEVLIFFIKSVAIIALSISLLVWLLSLFLWLTQQSVGFLGYSFEIPNNIKAAIIAVSGAIVVAIVALYGVHSQNISAEKRRNLDSSLSLRKDIFLEVAEAFSIQYQYLLSFADPTVSESNRKSMLTNPGKAFFKLHLVASEKTIISMLEANEEWSKVMIDISLHTKERKNEGIALLDHILKETVPFMQKLWIFNITARSEIENRFDEENSYLIEMNKNYDNLLIFINNLRLKIEEGNSTQ